MSSRIQGIESELLAAVVEEPPDPEFRGTHSSETSRKTEEKGYGTFPYLSEEDCQENSAKARRLHAKKMPFFLLKHSWTFLHALPTHILAFWVPVQEGKK